MGNCLCNPSAQFNKKELVVATLNYCGIMQSPYEFYVEEYMDELKQISNTFEKIIAENYNIKNFNKRNQKDEKGQKSKFKWKGGKLDHWFRPDRYSPMFDSMVGYDIRQQKFLTKKEFEEKWDQQFDKHLGTTFKDVKKR